MIVVPPLYITVLPFINQNSDAGDVTVIIMYNEFQLYTSPLSSGLQGILFPLWRTEKLQIE